jgi:hypothetical protein
MFAQLRQPVSHPDIYLINRDPDNGGLIFEYIIADLLIGKRGIGRDLADHRLYAPPGEAGGDIPDRHREKIASQRRQIEQQYLGSQDISFG